MTATTLETVKQIVGHHVKRYGGDWGECLSEGYISAAKAAERYDSDKGAEMNTWLTLCVRGDLINTFVRHKAHQNRHRRLTAGTPAAGDKFDLERFLADLTPDSRYAVSYALSLDLPPAQIKKAVIKKLKAEGWPEMRALKALGQIKEALVP